MKKKYNVTVVWSMMGSYDILADSKEEAVEIALDAPLPHTGEYLEGSFEIDSIEEADKDPHAPVCLVCGLPLVPEEASWFMCQRCIEAQIERGREQ